MQFERLSIELCQPCLTVRHLMVEALSEAGAVVLGAEPLTAPPRAPDLLVFDVDALHDAASLTRLRMHESRGKPVLCCGLRHLREDAQHRPWLERPFTTSALLYQCAELLGIGAPGAPPQGQDEPITRDALPDADSLSEASLLEEAFGLEPGILGGAEVDLSEVDDALDIMVIGDDEADLIVGVDEALETGHDAPSEAEDEHPFGVGALIGQVQARSVDLSQLSAPQLSLAPPVRGDTLAPTTQPDRPIAPEPGAPSTPLDPEASLELQSFARMIAEAWDRLSLSARVEDRSDRLNRVMHALFERGLEGASEALRRVPGSQGFSGSLRTLTLVGLFRTIRDRKLRGRLELALQDQAYVLYVDQGVLAEIDELTGDSDQLVISLLCEHGLLDPRLAQPLLSQADDLELGPPALMQLRQRGLVDDATLAHAQQLRARALFRRLCGARDGSFAFIEINQGDDHAWPRQELRLSVEELLLEVLREASIETGDSRANSRAMLQTDATRVASLDASRLTPSEQRILDFFRQGGTLQQARERFGEERSGEVSRVVNLLKRAELIKRTDPQRVALKHEERTVITGMSAEFEALREESALPQLPQAPYLPQSALPVQHAYAHPARVPPPDLERPSLDDDEVTVTPARTLEDELDALLRGELGAETDDALPHRAEPDTWDK